MIKKHATLSNEAPMNNEFMLASEVARIKDVAPATVRQWESKGLLKALRTANGTRIFARSDVEKFERPRRRK
jgi:DNA-binding transcriptional MerR regulator